MKDATGFPINCGSFIGNKSPSYIFKKPSITKDKFKISAIPVNRILSSGSSSIITDKDIQVYSNTNSSYITDYIINVQYLTAENFTINFNSQNPNIIQSPINSIAYGISNGNTNIIGYGIDNSCDVINLNVEYSIGSTSISFYDYVTNSVGKHCCNSVDSRLSGKNPSTTNNIFNIQDHNAAIYQRNVNCWCYDIDLTSISPWNSRGINTRAGTLISPRHILFAAHYPLQAGDTIRFITLNNIVVTKTITNTLIHPLYNGYGCDIGIGILDSDVPNTIGFVKILPSTWSNKIPSLYNMSSYINAIPVFYTNQQEKALVCDWYYYKTTGNNSTAGFRIPPNNTRLSFNEYVISGDSGNPIMLIINNQLVILTTFTTSGSGSFTTYFKNDINTMMNQLGGGYQLTEIDLSSFNSY